MGSFKRQLRIGSAVLRWIDGDGIVVEWRTCNRPFMGRFIFPDGSRKKFGNAAERAAIIRETGITKGTEHGNV